MVCCELPTASGSCFVTSVGPLPSAGAFSMAPWDSEGDSNALRKVQGTHKPAEASFGSPAPHEGQVFSSATLRAQDFHVSLKQAPQRKASLRAHRSHWKHVRSAHGLIHHSVVALASGASAAGRYLLA